MKRIAWRPLVLPVTALALFLGIAAPAWGDEHQGCSYRSVSGRWGWRLSGSYVDLTDPRYPNDTPAIGAGTFTLDGHGNVTGAGSLGGGNAKLTFAGSYSVTTDCTGDLAMDIILNGEDIGAFNASLVFVDGSREVYWVSEQPDLLFNLVGKKLSGD